MYTDLSLYIYIYIYILFMYVFMYAAVEAAVKETEATFGKITHLWTRSSAAPLRSCASKGS